MKRLAGLFLSMLLAAIPAMELQGLLWLFFRRGLTDYLPTVGDWIYYWHEAASFAAVGINGGIYGNEETGSPASVIFQKGLSFTHSIVFPAIQGTFGRIFGWHSYSPILFNIAVVALALLVLGFAARHNLRFLCVAVLFTASSLVLVTCIGVCNQEATNAAIGITLAGLYIALLISSDERSTRTITLVLLAFTWFCCLIRTDWVVAFIPVLFAPGPWLKYSRQWFKRIVLFLFLASSSVAFYFFFFSPYPYELFPGAQQHGMLLYSKLLSGDTAPLFNHIKANLALLATPATYAGNPMMIICVLLPTFVVGLLLLKFKRMANPQQRSQCFFFVTLIATNILAIVFLFVIFYNVMFIPRIVAPHFMLCFFVMAYFLPWHFAVLVLIFNLSTFTCSLKSFRDQLSFEYGARNAFTKATLAKDAGKLNSVLNYDPGKNPWCNTLLLLSYSPGPIMQTIAPGIALQNMRIDPIDVAKPYKYSERKPQDPFYAKYIFVDDAQTLEFISKHNAFKHLARVSTGDIYLNVSSPTCGSDPHEDNQ